MNRRASQFSWSSHRMVMWAVHWSLDYLWVGLLLWQPPADLSPRRAADSTCSDDYSYRLLHTMNTAAFCHVILQSMLLSSTMADADECADLFDADVIRVLDLNAPLGTVRRRCGQRDNCSLPEEARHAKQIRRWLERRHRRTGLPSDQQAYCDTQLPVAE